MPQLSKYPFNTSDSNSGAPDPSVQSGGFADEQVLTSIEQNVFIAQGSNWAGDFKTLATINDSTLDIGSSSALNVYDFITLTSAVGCVVNFDLSSLGTGRFSIGQVITIYNNSPVNSSYTVNGSDDPNNLIHPQEVVRFLIYNSTTVLNLTELNDTTPIGSLEIRLSSSPRRGWLILNGTSVKTIGSSASTAAYNNDKYESLFSTLWNSFGNLTFPVSGGRGVSASDDFQDNKTIDLSSLNDRVLAFDSSSNPVGTKYGIPIVSLTEAELPVINLNDKMTDEGHTHEVPLRERGDGSGNDAANFSGGDERNVETSSKETGITFSNIGGGESHENRQPTFVPFIFIKY